MALPAGPAAATANLLVRRRAWSEVGGFLEGASLGTEFEFCWRLADAGWRLEYRPGARVEHLHRETLRDVVRQFSMYAAGDAWLNRRRPGRGAAAEGARAARPMRRRDRRLRRHRPLRAGADEGDRRGRDRRPGDRLPARQRRAAAGGDRGRRSGPRRLHRLLPRPHRAVRHPRARRARRGPGAASGSRPSPAPIARSRAERAASRPTGSRTRAPLDRLTALAWLVARHPAARRERPPRAPPLRPRRAAPAARAGAGRPSGSAAAESAISTFTSRRWRRSTRCGSARLAGGHRQHHAARPRDLRRAAQRSQRSSRAPTS